MGASHLAQIIAGGEVPGGLVGEGLGGVKAVCVCGLLCLWWCHRLHVVLL